MTPTLPGFSTFLLPLANVPQTFDITINGVDYTMTCKFNSAPDAGWAFDLQDANTGAPIAANIPLITGCDCLAGLEYLGIGGQFIVYTDGDDTAIPTLDNLGIQSNLYFLTTQAAPNG